jgi:hypothetical protein
MTNHLSPEAIAWVRERIASRNWLMASTKSQRLEQAYDDERRLLIDLLVTFTGADRDELRNLSTKGNA